MPSTAFEKDVEAGSAKDTIKASSPMVDDSDNQHAQPELANITERPQTPVGKLGLYIQNLESYLAKYKFEARGIDRVLVEDTHPTNWRSYIQAFFFWFSVNLAAQNITLGMLGPYIFYLSFRDATLCAAFGAMIGSLPVAHISTFAPISGLRTLVFARFTFGWWPTKLLVILNMIVLAGYSLIDLVIGGQILSAISPSGNLSIVVGIIIVGLICWIISTFGLTVFHLYQRYAWIPQLIAICILFGVSSSKYDLKTPSQGDPKTVIASRISFFSLCFSAAITYTGSAADFFVYYSPSTSRPLLFLAAWFGLTTSFVLAFTAGTGLASGIPIHKNYESAYKTSQGALIVEGFSPLHGFGKFLSVVVFFSLVSNTVLPSYSIGIDFQLLARFAQRVPRFVWNTAGVIIYTVCALAGRNSLSEIFTNFLALMGYWVAIWVAVSLEEQILFRGGSWSGSGWWTVPIGDQHGYGVERSGSFRGGSKGRWKGYEWTVWNQQEKLPLGLAALVAFLVGWAGAILSMAQVWYTGPIAGKVGEHGADIGNYVAFSWAAIIYPPLRYFELQKWGR
ncbi:uncharacterized protein KY384_001367 [Bacidia gigantensis]|uniref:uncharacterized protein n=1 Tax=Bacidia gigantensis TaxID=2732470 RepID=UPI001D045A7B|nr:uncharacterized protein KY384_001367 [Bacidia gigantensis]KAG8533627.1 hypothetical protein KY384_001367 [Bacidia gigantensis]